MLQPLPLLLPRRLPRRQAPALQQRRPAGQARRNSRQLQLWPCLPLAERLPRQWLLWQTPLPTRTVLQLPWRRRNRLWQQQRLQRRLRLYQVGKARTCYLAPCMLA